MLHEYIAEHYLLNTFMYYAVFGQLHTDFVEKLAI